METNVYKTIYNYDNKEIGYFTKYGSNSVGVFLVTLEPEELVLTALFKENPMIKKIKYQDITNAALSLSTGFSPALVGGFGGLPNVVYQFDICITYQTQEIVLEFRKYLAVPAFLEALKSHEIECQDPMDLLSVIEGKDAPEINRYFLHNIQTYRKKYSIENPRAFKRYIKT